MTTYAADKLRPDRSTPDDGEKISDEEICRRRQYRTGHLVERAVNEPEGRPRPPARPANHENEDD